MTPDSNGTRTFDTVHGELAYSEVNERVAEPLRLLINEINEGAFLDFELNPHLLQEFHRRICGDLTPAIAGQLRHCAVRIGHHYPPEHIYVSQKLWEYFDDINARMMYIRGDLQNTLELLAYVEAKGLHIHPFVDFNGRAIRALVYEVMRRIDFPPIEISIDAQSALHKTYIRALREFDIHQSLNGLVDIWKNHRFPAFREQFY
ncbi:Fic family protein [Corynebacterium sp.]|uniref:Fic family protein n=1 Tax=Corynebacterium sp. TaxID=1720 RepID=UPI0026DD21DF|nr:Fic family protein [Corynebacterium sp.]MDO5076035.1 Fic family protein [Corynebacterium sp.]